MPQQEEFVIVTGLSGAGKSLAIRAFEDMNYFCVDNLLPALIPKFAQICAHSQVKKVALVIDIRGKQFFKELLSALSEIHKYGFKYKILFLEASDEVLVRRFSETRRKHPLSSGGRILDGIKAERRQLEEIKGMADKVIDTGALTSNQLKKELSRLFLPSRDGKTINITIVSFGYKYGVPLDADLVYDVRFLPNPYYAEKLRNLTGNNDSVRDYVLKSPQTKKFMKKFFDFNKFLIPEFVKEGKSHLTIAIGCTGGRHRSIVMGNELARSLQQNKYRVRVEHRDLKK